MTRLQRHMKTCIAMGLLDGSRRDDMASLLLNDLQMEQQMHIYTIHVGGQAELVSVFSECAYYQRWWAEPEYSCTFTGGWTSANRYQFSS